jgi:hypothetical protein
MVGTTDVENVDVDGERGIWIGGCHALYLLAGCLGRPATR